MTFACDHRVPIHEDLRVKAEASYAFFSAEQAVTGSAVTLASHDNLRACLYAHSAFDDSATVLLDSRRRVAASPYV